MQTYKLFSILPLFQREKATLWRDGNLFPEKKTIISFKNERKLYQQEGVRGKNRWRMKKNASYKGRNVYFFILLHRIMNSR